MMLLRSCSSPGLNYLTGLQPESGLSSRRSVQLTQLHVVGNVDGQWVNHVVQPSFERTLSEADLHNPLSNACSRRLGLRWGSDTLYHYRKLCTEIFLSNGLLDEALQEEFEDSDIQISIGFQSAGDLHEESREIKMAAVNGLLDEALQEEFEDSDIQISIGFQSAGDLHEESREIKMAAVGTHRSEEPSVSGRRDEDLMRGRIFEGTGVAFVSDRAVVGSKTETGSVNGGFGGEDGRGRGYGGRGGGSGSDSNNADAYYKKMLQANPDNPLLLTNYARFLQEVQRDLEKAEEYYGRAILASPGDADVLSLYANLIWDVYKDAPRAESYHDQAVEAAPDSCNVLGSYAHFLWNAEDDEEDQAPQIYYGTATTAATEA